MTTSALLALSAFHAIVFAALWSARRHAHPWLLIFYGHMFLANLALTLIISRAVGGLDLLGADRGETAIKGVRWVLWIWLWISYWFVPALTAERLRRGRVSWLPWVLTLVAIGILFAILGALRVQSLVEPAVTRRLLHWVLEPALLLWTIFNLVLYCQQSLQELVEPDLLALALGLEAIAGFLRLMLALDVLLKWRVSIALSFHLIEITVFTGVLLLHARRRSQRLATSPISNIKPTDGPPGL